MSPQTRLNMMLAAGIFLLVAVNGAAFTYSLWGPGVKQAIADYWKAHAPTPAKKAGDRTISECLGVSDFYSAHLTTYFLADSDDSAGGATNDMSKYDEYCDRVPGTGKLIFAITLMEKEARNEAVALSFHATQPDGALKELAALPPKPHGAGMLTLEATAAHRGKYVLRLSFGAAKNKEDIIDMPITVGQ